MHVWRASLAVGLGDTLLALLLEVGSLFGLDSVRLMIDAHVWGHVRRNTLARLHLHMRLHWSIRNTL